MRIWVSSVTISGSVHILSVCLCPCRAPVPRRNSYSRFACPFEASVSPSDLHAIISSYTTNKTRSMFQIVPWTVVPHYQSFIWISSSSGPHQSSCSIPSKFTVPSLHVLHTFFVSCPLGQVGKILIHYRQILVTKSFLENCHPHHIHFEIEELFHPVSQRKWVYFQKAFLHIMITLSFILLHRTLVWRINRTAMIEPLKTSLDNWMNNTGVVAYKALTTVL